MTGPLVAVRTRADADVSDTVGERTPGGVMRTRGVTERNPVESVTRGDRPTGRVVGGGPDEEAPRAPERRARRRAPVSVGRAAGRAARRRHDGPAAPPTGAARRSSRCGARGG